MTRMNRRTFTKTMLAGLSAAAAPVLRAAEPRNLKIGYTTLIWGAVPRTPENLEPAVKDISALGFYGFETFAAILDDWDTAPLISADHTVQLMDASTRKENLAQLVKFGKVVKKYGGRFVVLAPNGVKRDGYNFQEHRQAIVASLDEYAKAVTDLGLGTGLHQHTGTCVETRDEVYAVMEAVNTMHLKFAPDVGQLQKGGADAAKVVKDFLPITVHMHLKDFVGGPHFAGYCPLGQGKVDLKAILDMMESANPKANVMVELDGSANQPYTPLETAQISKAYLQKLGYTFRS
ncbi:MAG: xylose isomerase [Acidobacteria bacterium]|nr:MAG: xylose isomerase [Acidobacteriota bacterium]